MHEITSPTKDFGLFELLGKLSSLPPLHQARETLRVMLMVQRRKRTQFTQKFKEHLEKVEGMIQEAIESLPDADIEGQEDVKDVKGLKEGEAKSVEEQEKDTCSNLDRIMCQIVDQLSQDL